MRSTKKSLIMSTISLVLCFAMLLGSTYAWFTDEVTSGTNKIIAGNLDVELYHKDKAITGNAEEVTETVKLFDDVALWEPGAYAYETFTIKNVGNLALKYKMALNVAAFTSYAGHDLTEVLKVATLDSVPTSRADITGGTALKDWSLDDGGILYPNESSAGDSEKTFTVAIYWEPGENDNNYNMNNGITQTLSVDLGVKLIATQVEHEFDSFDNLYDAGTDIALPETVIVSEIAVENTPTVFTTKNTPANDEGKSTTVTFEANALEADASYQLTAETYNALASTANFIVTAEGPSDNAVAAIDLTLVKKAEDSEVEVSNFGDNKTVKVDTYITKNLENAVVTYGGNPFINKGSVEAVTEAGTYFYDGATGHLVFCTNHFSEYLVGSSSVAYVQESDTAYSTIAEAITGAEADNEIVMLKNATVNEVTDFSKSVTLNLNGKTVTAGDNGKFTFKKDGATVTVENGKLVGGENAGYLFDCTGANNSEKVDNAVLNLKDITYTGTNGFMSAENGWVTYKGLTVNVDGGSYTSVKETFRSYMASDILFNFKGVAVSCGEGPCVQTSAGAATFEDCNFTVGDTAADQAWYKTAVAVAHGGKNIIKSGTYTAPYAVYNYSTGGSTFITGGIFSGSTAAVYLTSGEVVISGGNINGALTANNNTVRVLGGSFTVAPTGFKDAGCTVTEKDGKYIVEQDNGYQTITCTSGRSYVVKTEDLEGGKLIKGTYAPINAEDKADLIAEGYEQNGSGAIVVHVDAVVYEVDSVDDWNTAMNDTSGGAINVKLTGNVTGSVDHPNPLLTIPSGKTINLDLNGHNITNNGGGGRGIKITDATMNITNSGASATISSYLVFDGSGNVNIDVAGNVTLSGSNVKFGLDKAKTNVVAVDETVTLSGMVFSNENDWNKDTSVSGRTIWTSPKS